MVRVVGWDDQNAITHYPLRIHNDVIGLDEGRIRCCSLVLM
jgi:hypothetical protein